MKRYRQLSVRSRPPAPPAAVAEWLRRPAAAARLEPPWGDQPAALSGWDHDQRIAADGTGAVLEDQLRATAGETPPGTEAPLRLLVFRHRQLARDVARHVPPPAGGASPSPGTPLVVAISGASGFIGSALTSFLAAAGHQVRPLVRRRAAAGEIAWDPDGGSIEAEKLEGVDAVVHLAGESIAGGRWTEARKQRIAASRLEGTALVARTLARLSRPPRVLVSGSAMGYYGFVARPPVDESASPGSDFLAQLAVRWEAAAAPAAERGIRVAHPRFGNVLDPRGGALAKLLPIYRAGLGGKLGSGKQPFPWVALDDALGALHLAIMDERLRGPFNLVSPGAVSNSELSSAIAEAAHRPDLFFVPGWALKLAFGELARSLLSGPEIRPARLEAVGFRFHHRALRPALAEMLGTFPLPEPAVDGDRLHLEL